MGEKSNATRFISAYNRLDRVMRTRYNLKGNVTFSEAVRICASRNSVVRKYEDDLMDYARLRNAIVHKSDTDMIIAEPHMSVVKTIEHIESAVSCPPRADLTVAKNAVTLESDTPLDKAIAIMAKSNFSNAPITKNGQFMGVTSNKLIVEAIAKNLDGDMDEFLRNSNIASTLAGETNHYTLAAADTTVDVILQLFISSPKLQIVVLTIDGSAGSQIVGVVTTGDLVAINKLLDNL